MNDQFEDILLRTSTTILEDPHDHEIHRFEDEGGPVNDEEDDTHDAPTT